MIYVTSRRRRSWNRPRPLRFEPLEDRSLLSLTAAVAAEDVFPRPAAELSQSGRGSKAGTTSTALAIGAAVEVSSERPGSTVPGPVPSSPKLFSTPLLQQIEGSTTPGSPLAATPPRPNLIPFKPADWSDKIVVSNVQGTNVGGALSPDDELYVDWAVQNIGSRPVTRPFQVKLFVDGKLRNTRLIETPLDVNEYVSVEDFSIGRLGVGQHKIQIQIDTANAVAESNEKDNGYTKTITVSRPNLTPFLPKGWSDKIVVSSRTGTHAADKLYSNQTLYVDWAVINNGKPPVKQPFETRLYVDGELKNTWVTNPPLNGNSPVLVEDFALGPLSPGKHTIQLRVDATRAVVESNEKDNVFTKTITVYRPILKPNLTPYQPSGWSNKIVVSTTRGTNTDSGSFLVGQTLYVDWAGINNGDAATDKPFNSQLFVNGNLVRTFTSPAPLNPGEIVRYEDVSIGALSPGRHTIEIRLDSGGVIGEHNESDNSFSRTITVASRPTIEFVVNYTDSPGEGFFDPQRGSQRRAAFEYGLGIWSNALAKAYEGERITVSASMDPMGGSANWAVFGWGGPNYLRWNFGGAALANTVYSDALANHLAGRDLAPGSPEIVARFNSDIDSPAVLGSIDWYYGLDGNPGDDVDFVSVVVHELGHGLNFLHNIDASSGAWNIGGYPGIFDRFLETGGGTRLTSLDNAGRKAAITSNNLFWGGSQGRGGNGGVRPKMYAPNPYDPSSSVSHTDEATHEYDLMSPLYSGPNHSPSPIVLGMLADMGWNPRSSASTAMVQGTAIAALGEEGFAPFAAWMEQRYECTPQVPVSREGPSTKPFDLASVGNDASFASAALSHLSWGAFEHANPQTRGTLNPASHGYLNRRGVGITAAGVSISASVNSDWESYPIARARFPERSAAWADTDANARRIALVNPANMRRAKDGGRDLVPDAFKGGALEERCHAPSQSKARLRDLALAAQAPTPRADQAT